MPKSPDSKSAWSKLPTIQTGERTKNVLSNLFGIEINVQGQEHLNILQQADGTPNELGAFFSAFPHNGHPDGLIMRMALPPELRHKLIVLAKENHFGRKHLLRNFISLFLKMYPISSESVSGILGALRLIQDKNAYVALFTEGTRGNYGKPIEERHLEQGLAFLQFYAGDAVPLFLVNIEGAADFWPKHQHMPSLLLARRQPVTITFSKPIYRRDLFSAEILDPEARTNFGRSVYREMVKAEVAVATIKIQEMHVALAKA